MHRVRGRLGKAESLLEKVCALDPSHVEIALYLARIRLSRGRFAKARRGLEAALLPTGFSPAILIQIAELQIDEGDFESARDNLQKATDRGAPAHAVRFPTARIEELEGNDDRALELAREGLREDPDDNILLALSWRCASRSVSPDEAAAMCEAYASRPERSVAGMLEAARFLRGMERWERGLAILDRAAALNSTDPEVARERAECLIGRNDLREASLLLEDILRETPGDRDAAFLLARCEADMGNPGKALERLETNAGRNLASVELKVECRLRLADSGVGTEMLVREALSDIEDGYSDFPDHPNLVALEIRALRRAGRKEDALSRAGRLPETSIRGPAVGALFDLYIESGRPNRAESLLSGLPEKLRRTIWARLFRSRLLLAMGRDAEASLLLEDILRETPGDRDAAFLLARCEADMGNPGKALERLETNAGRNLASVELKVECRLRLADSGVGTEMLVREALSDIEDGYSDFPDHPNLVALEIRALRRAGRKEDALSRAGRLPETSIRGPAVGALFDLYIESGHPNRAESLLSGLPEKLRRTIWARLFRSRLLLAKGREAEAEALLEEILAENPEHAPTLIALARLRADGGRVSEAKRRLVETHATSSLPRDALIELARLQIGDREYQAAMDSLEEATRDGGQTVDAMHLAAFAEERRGNVGRALEMAREGLRDHPGHVPFETMRWRCTSMSASHDEAEALCEAYAARPDCPAEGLLEAARFMRILARWDRSLALLDRAAMLDPDNPAVDLERAQCLMDRRDPLNASLGLKELARNSPGNLWAEILLAQCEANLGDVRSALDRLDAKSGSHAAMTQIRAECLLMIGDVGAAEKQLDLLRDADAETRAWAGARKADLALSRGMPAEALAGIEDAVALDPDNMLLNQRLSMIRLLNGDFEGARDSNIAYVETRYASDVSRMSSRKERSSVHGRILNEFRLIGEDLPIAGYFAKRDPDSALPELRRLIEGHEDNTPAAMAMLALLCRAGHVTETPPPAAAKAKPIPRQVFQYWDQSVPPEQVVWLMERNARSAPDFAFRRFDRRGGEKYLREKGEKDAATSFSQAPNATARADILRLALLWHEGGIYLDADDRIVGSLDDLLPPGLDFVGYQDEYMCVANNFLAASAGHPVIRNALDSATLAYFDYLSDELWLASGPGAVTRAIAHRGTTAGGGLAQGIWIMPSYRLRPVVAPHILLSYKSTDVHWVKGLAERRKT